METKENSKLIPSYVWVLMFILLPLAFSNCGKKTAHTSKLLSLPIEKKKYVNMPAQKTADQSISSRFEFPKASFTLGSMDLCRFKDGPNSRIYNQTQSQVAERLSITETQFQLAAIDYVKNGELDVEKLRQHLTQTVGYWLQYNLRNRALLTVLFAALDASSKGSRGNFPHNMTSVKFSSNIRWAPSDSSFIFIAQNQSSNDYKSRLTYEYFCYSIAKIMKEMVQGKPETAWERVSYKIGNEPWFIFESARAVKDRDGNWQIGAAPLRLKVAMMRAGMRGVKRALLDDKEWNGNLDRLDALDCPATIFWGDLDCVPNKSGTVEWKDGNTEENMQSGTDYSYKVAEILAREVDDYRRENRDSRIGISQIFFNAVSVHLYRFRYHGPYDGYPYYFGKDRQWGKAVTMKDELEWCKDFLRDFRAYGMPQRLSITEYGFPQIARFDVYDEYGNSKEWGAYLKDNGYNSTEAFDNYCRYISDLYPKLTNKFNTPDWYTNQERVRTSLYTIFARLNDDSKAPSMTCPSVSERKSARYLVEALHIINEWNKVNSECPIITLHWYVFAGGVYPDLAGCWHYYNLITSPTKIEGNLVGTSGLDFSCWLAPVTLTGLSLINHPQKQLLSVLSEQDIPFQSRLDYKTFAEYAIIDLKQGKYELSLGSKYPNLVSSIKVLNESFFSYIPWDFDRDYSRLQQGERDLYLFIVKDSLPFFSDSDFQPTLVFNAGAGFKAWSGEIKDKERIIITENPKFWQESNAGYKWGYPSGYIWGTLRVRKL